MRDNSRDMECINVNIKITGMETITVSIDQHETVSALKRVIEERTRIDYDRQRLVLMGKVLKDEVLLTDSGTILIYL